MDPQQQILGGTHIVYYTHCHRKLWLYSHGIRQIDEHVNVQIGRHIQESTFDRREKDIPIGEVGVVDWMELKDGVIHETKKGKAPKKAEIAQVRYYMWWMRKQGMKVNKAIIHYPKQRKSETVEWEDSMSSIVEKDIENALKIIGESKPPPVINKSYCKKCSYYELCYG